MSDSQDRNAPRPATGGEWLLVRHAPIAEAGILCGRTDAACVAPDPAVAERLARAAGRPDRIVCSPATRCAATARAVFPGIEPAFDERLWEQDFGEWEGLAHRDVPDLGPLAPEELALRRAPGGESFAEACARIAAGLRDLPAGRTIVFAHAGTVRAALAMALGSPAAALAFEVAPLSTTLVRALPGGHYSIGHVNRAP